MYCGGTCVFWDEGVHQIPIFMTTYGCTVVMDAISDTSHQLYRHLGTASLPSPSLSPVPAIPVPP